MLSLVIGGVLATAAGGVEARGVSASARPAPAAVTAFTPAQRAKAIRSFVLRWSGYVGQQYGIDAKTWALRMVPVFATGDSDNIRRALQRDTFEGAMAALDGRASRISDSQVIDRLARLPATSASAKTQAIATKFGDLSADLVFTPVQPCRIVDTRVAGGPIAANGTRSFRGINSGSFAGQGGSGGNCGTSGLSAAALALNVTAVVPSGAGYATVFPFGTSQPLAASVNYVAGAIVNNTVFAQIPNPQAAFDFSIFSLAASDYVVDIVGYFAPPVATALDCTQTYVAQSVAANATFDIAIPACPGTHTLTGAGCRTAGFNQADWAINGYAASSASATLTYCSGQNKTSGPITIEGSARCCRVPGR